MSSGSVDFTLSRDALILEALAKLRVGFVGDDVDPETIARATRTFNLQLKSFQSQGMHLWMVRHESITLTQSKSVYSLGPTGDVVMDRPLKIVECHRRRDAIDTPLTLMERSEYWDLSNKTAEGIPVNYYFDPQLDNSLLYIWPTASLDAATNITIEIEYSKPFDDMDSALDNLEFPQEWYEAVVYGLAWRLAPSFGVPIALRRELRAEALSFLEEARGFDTESGSVYFGAESR